MLWSRQYQSPWSDRIWDSEDPALAFAINELTYYEVARRRGRLTYRVIEIVLLVAAAVTTLAAALQAAPWITASLATVSFVFTGLRKIFDSHQGWLAAAQAWQDLRTTIVSYRGTPPESRDQSRLIADTNAVAQEFIHGWVRRRDPADKQSKAG